MISPRRTSRRSPRQSRSPRRRYRHKSRSREHRSSKEGRRDRSRSQSRKAAAKGGHPKSVSPLGRKEVETKPEEEAAVELQMSPVTPRESDADLAFALPAGTFPFHKLQTCSRQMNP